MPSCFNQTIELIERSFHYKKPNSFEIDFTPLVDKSNHHNCFILIDENEKVLAHVGVKERTLRVSNKTFPLTLLGGIAVDESRRGEGIFQTLFQDVLAEKRSDTSMFLLWSDLEKLYTKFGFHLCGTQIEVSSKKKASPFQKTTYSALSPLEKKDINALYETSFCAQYVSLERTENDWDQLARITSADLFIRKNGDRIQDYYFMNKGQDLPGIIYEYGTLRDFKAFVEEIKDYGSLWLGKNLIESENLQYQFFLCPGDLRLFSELVTSFTDGAFSVRNINVMKQEVFFDFNDETLSLEMPEFLRGVFGPGKFEELNDLTIFISGLDSI